MGKNRKEIAIVTKSAWPMCLTQKGIIHSIICDAIGIGALCVSANLEVPLQPVPFTLQVLALAFIVAAFDVREAAVTTAGYVVIGALGAPVFSGALGGIIRLVGPTGGFILGFVVAAIVGSWLRIRLEHTHMPWVVACLLSLVVTIAIVYACGWMHLMVVGHLSAVSAFTVGVAPFVVLDLMKAGIASCLTAAARIAMGKDMH